MALVDKILRRWMRFRLQPIHVFCLHHVCEHFDAESMHEGDWIALDTFKQKVLAMQRSGRQFISLSKAHDELTHSFSPFAFRLSHYVVLTFDDGYASLREVLPWLKEQGIPVTLFINPDYAAGNAYRESNKEKYLTLAELSELDVEIGIHGLQHVDATKMTPTEFRIFVEESIKATQKIDGYIPFWAYTWGRHTSTTDSILKEQGIIPVYVDGMKNYNAATGIHRELLLL